MNATHAGLDPRIYRLVSKIDKRTVKEKPELQRRAHHQLNTLDRQCRYQSADSLITEFITRDLGSPVDSTLSSILGVAV